MKWSPEDWSRLGHRIRAERDALGIGREKLAEMADTSARTIQNAEEGRVPSRWPPTFARIERALRWAPGSMQAVLDGGPPTGLDPGVDNTTPAAAGAPGWFKLDRHGGAPESSAREDTGHYVPVAERLRRSSMETPHSFPEEIEQLLPAVLRFGAVCAAHGAPEQMAAWYDDVVQELLSSLRIAQFRESSSEAVPQPSSRPTPQVASVTPGMQQMAAQVSAHQERMKEIVDGEALARALTESIGYTAARRMAAQPSMGSNVARLFWEQNRGIQEAMQKALTQGEQFQAAMARLSAPVRQAVAADLYEGIQPYLPGTDDTEESPEGLPQDGDASSPRE